MRTLREMGPWARSDVDAKDFLRGPFCVRETETHRAVMRAVPSNSFSRDRIPGCLGDSTVVYI